MKIDKDTFDRISQLDEANQRSFINFINKAMETTQSAPEVHIETEEDSP